MGNRTGNQSNIKEPGWSAIGYGEPLQSESTPKLCRACCTLCVTRDARHQMLLFCTVPCPRTAIFFGFSPFLHPLSCFPLHLSPPRGSHNVDPCHRLHHYLSSFSMFLELPMRPSSFNINACFSDYLALGYLVRMVQHMTPCMFSLRTPSFQAVQRTADHVFSADKARCEAQKERKKKFEHALVLSFSVYEIRTGYLDLELICIDSFMLCRLVCLVFCADMS